ncbi:MAG: hypothetical protein AAF532_15495 [Planctomycetota bacterium]
MDKKTRALLAATSICAALYAMVFALLLYNHLSSNDQHLPLNAWGDFAAGAIAGPGLAFLITSVVIQAIELAATRDELVKTVDALRAEAQRARDLYPPRFELTYGPEAQSRTPPLNPSEKVFFLTVTPVSCDISFLKIENNSKKWNLAVVTDKKGGEEGSEIIACGIVHEFPRFEEDIKTFDQVTQDMLAKTAHLTIEAHSPAGTIVKERFSVYIGDSIPPLGRISLLGREYFGV